MPIYNETQFLSLPQQVQKNKTDIQNIEEQIANVGVGPQGVEGPRGPQGIQGETGPAGPDGTPVEGVVANSSQDANLSNYHTLNVNSIATTYAKKYLILCNGLWMDKMFLYLWLNDVEQTDRISIVDEIVVRKTNGYIFLAFYNTNGQMVSYEYQLDTVIIKIGFKSTAVDFSIHEKLGGSTVGPTGPAGATGPQGEDGPQGPQGVQGLPGLQNITYIETLVNEDLYDEISSQTLIQLVGGDYDGLTFIKDEIVADTFVKFGPYGSLVEFADGQVFLYQGVTSIKLYALDHLT